MALYSLYCAEVPLRNCSLTSSSVEWQNMFVSLHNITPRDWLVTRHFGHKTLRHQHTLGHFGTDLNTLRHQKRGTRHFDTSTVTEEKPGHFDPGQFQWDTAPPVIRLKLRHQFCGAEVSCGRSVRLPPEGILLYQAGTISSIVLHGNTCLSLQMSVNRKTPELLRDIIIAFSGCHTMVKRAGKFQNSYTGMHGWWLNVSDVAVSTQTNQHSVYTFH